MIKPTIEEMRDAWREDTELFDHVENKVCGTWRHGSEYQFIAKRLSDNTYWSVCYRTDPQGVYNDFREGDLTDSDVYQVQPIEVKVIEWSIVENGTSSQKSAT